MDHSFSYSKTYRYFTHGDKMKSKKLLIVMHGYGHLAEYFLRKFHSSPSSYFIVAPEGPHRFYKQGYSGRVGASWMTKEAREDDIKDNLNWLNALLHKVKSEKSYEEVSLLGFSQGGATAARWYYDEPNKFDKLILWSSVFPPDITKPNLKMSNTNLYVVGSKDEFINEKMRKKEIEFYQNIGFKTHVYNGNHDIDSSMLSEILS
jgi:predicted esterase